MKEQNETTPIPYPADPADTKRQLLIFLLVAYGVTYAMGILTWYGNAVSAELSAFPNAQMYYPAAGVMLAYMITRRKDNMLPKWFFVCFTADRRHASVCSALRIPADAVACPERPVRVRLGGDKPVYHNRRHDFVLDTAPGFRQEKTCGLRPWLETMEDFSSVYPAFPGSVFWPGSHLLSRRRADRHDS